MKYLPIPGIFILLLLSMQPANGQMESFIPPVKTSYNLISQISDTLQMDTLTSRSQIDHPLYKTFPVWSELGNYGQPALPARWMGIRRMHQPAFLQVLRPYYDDPEALLFYRSFKPYARLFYSSGGSQDANGQLINACFARPVSPGLLLSADFDFISSDGHFPNQSSSVSDLVLNFDFERERYKLIAGYETSNFKHGESGGIVDPTGYSGLTSAPESTPVNLRDAASVTSLQIISGRQEFRIFDKPVLPNRQDSVIPADSLHPPDLFLDRDVVDSTLQRDTFQAEEIRVHKPVLFHSFSYQIAKRLYKDKESAANSYYKNFYQSTSQSTDSVRFQYFSNRMGVTKTYDSFSELDLVVQGGLHHALTNWQADNFTGRYQQLSFFGTLQGSYRSWNANAYADIRFVGPGSGAYDFHVELQKKSSKSPWAFDTEIGSVLDLPDIFTHAFSGNHDRWLTSRNMQSEQYLKFSAFQSKWKMRMGSGFHVIDNLLYYDYQANANQADQAAILLSAFMTKKFTAGPFHSDNQVIIQYTPSKEIPLPLIVAATSTFLHHDIHFKQTGGLLELEYGLDLRYSSSYEGYAWQPSSAVFYLQNTRQLGNYPYVDLFLLLRVKRTRVFVKWEHVNGGLTGNGFYPVLNYPLPSRIFRYGVYWHFYD